MEHHGDNPRQNVIAVIPARYASTRLPGKLLRDLGGEPLIVHTARQAAAASTVERVIVAADDERILAAVHDAGFEGVLTSPDHQSGSDRVAEVAETLPEGSIVVNVQGDEPLIDPETIDRAVNALVADPEAAISTTAEPIESLADLLNGNVVKVVTSDRGYALYFSRSPMPFPRDASLRYNGDPGSAIANEPELLKSFRKHTGLYAYRREYLLKFSKLPQTTLETFEMLEQIRALEDGAKIRVVEAASSSIGVDTEDDLQRVNRILEARSISIRFADMTDVPAVANVHVETWSRSFKGLAPENYLNNLSTEQRARVFGERLESDNYRLLVAETPATGIVGFIDYGRPDFENFGYDGRIFSFYLLPEYQRLGIGEKLFRECFRSMAKDGYRSVCLDTLEISPYRRFYEKKDGRVVARDRHKLADEEFPTTLVYGWDRLEG